MFDLPLRKEGRPYNQWAPAPQHHAHAADPRTNFPPLTRYRLSAEAGTIVREYLSPSRNNVRSWCEPSEFEHSSGNVKLKFGDLHGIPIPKNEILVVSRGLSSYKRLGKIQVISTRTCKDPGIGVRSLKDPAPNRNWNKAPNKVGLVTTDKLNGVISPAPEKNGTWCFSTSKSGVMRPYF